MKSRLPISALTATLGTAALVGFAAGPASAAQTPERLPMAGSAAGYRCAQGPCGNAAQSPIDTTPMAGWLAGLIDAPETIRDLDPTVIGNQPSQPNQTEMGPVRVEPNAPAADDEPAAESPANPGTAPQAQANPAAAPQAQANPAAAPQAQANPAGQSQRHRHAGPGGGNATAPQLGGTLGNGVKTIDSGKATAAVADLDKVKSLAKELNLPAAKALDLLKSDKAQDTKPAAPAAPAAGVAPAPAPAPGARYAQPPVPGGQPAGQQAGQPAAPAAQPGGKPAQPGTAPKAKEGIDGLSSGLVKKLASGNGLLALVPGAGSLGS